jgi:hypothetical protein
MLSFFMPITYGAMIMTNYEEVGKERNTIRILTT